jgi:hypothetical protein
LLGAGSERDLSTDWKTKISHFVRNDKVGVFYLVTISSMVLQKKKNALFPKRKRA